MSSASVDFSKNSSLNRNDTTNLQVIQEDIRQWRHQVDTTITQLFRLTEEIGHTELKETVASVRDRLFDPYMFVIVGEVKSGKSSFINALLDTGTEICKVAPSPMTDTIQQIVYGEDEKTVDINPYLKKIFQPVDILRDIAIVDTPGTNTIIDHHQEITESFVPASDLIVFVFEAKNPYRQSAWSFFDFIKEEWRKKVIFILQQKDLMDDDDLAVNIEGVRKFAVEKGMGHPQIFAVSAKRELEGKKLDSGFEAVRNYILSNITGGRAPYLKLLNSIQTAVGINDRIFRGVILRREQLDADVRFRQDIRQTLDHQEEKSSKQVDFLVENLVASYDRITRKYTEEVKGGLSFLPMLKRSFQSMFSLANGPKEWLESLTKALESDLNTQLKDRLNEGVLDIADSIQQMAKVIDLKIRNSETILKDNHDIFADIAEKRTSVLRELQQAFSDFLRSSENFYDDRLVSESGNMTPNLAAGSGIAIVGVILATITNGAVFDITGGILTTIGLLFAGVSVGLKRRKIVRGFIAEIDKGRTRIEEEVSERLKQYIHRIKWRIDENFTAFDEHLERETNGIQRLEARFYEIQEALENHQRSVENALPTNT